LYKTRKEKKYKLIFIYTSLLFLSNRIILSQTLEQEGFMNFMRLMLFMVLLASLKERL